MLEAATVHELLQALAKKAAADEIVWTQPAKDRYSVDLASIIVSLIRRSHEGQPDIIFEVDSPEGKELGIVLLKSQDQDYNKGQELLRKAESYISNWNRTL